MLEKISNTSFRLTLEGDRTFEQWFLLTADRHWDNPLSNRELQKEHLEEVKKRNAYVIDIGDFFCAMQGKYDPRMHKKGLREEHNVDNYLDSLVTTAADWFTPYADRFLMIGKGNHETAILKRHETDLTQRLVTLLNYKAGTKIQAGTYTGWVIIRFKRKNSKESHLIKIHFDHGYGGGGPVTKGTIQANRRAVYLPDADIVLSGHIHESYYIEYEKERLNQNMVPVIDHQYHLSIPTYKEEYLVGEGFHREKGSPPKPLGAWWLRVYYRGSKDTLDFDFIRAK